MDSPNKTNVNEEDIKQIVMDIVEERKRKEAKTNTTTANPSKLERVVKSLQRDIRSLES